MIPSREEWMAALRERHGAELAEKFGQTTVAVCGLGGLGSNIAISLARAGVGKLILIDFDEVDITNLHRQQYKANQIGIPKPLAICENLSEIAPYVEMVPIIAKVTEENLEELLGEADIICEAFDKAEAKAMLVNGVLEKFPDKYLVSGSGMAGIGSPNMIKTRKVMKKFYLSGDEVSYVAMAIGLVAPRVMLCAAHEALTVLRIIAGEFDV